MPLLATDIKASTPKKPFLAIHSKAQQRNSSSCDTGLLLIRRDDSQHHMPLLATDIKASTQNPFLAIHSKAQQHNSSSCDTGVLLIRRTCGKECLTRAMLWDDGKKHIHIPCKRVQVKATPRWLNHWRV
jgi:hypothetical protein